MKGPRLPPPRPELVRTPQGGFGWLEQRLLQDGWLRDLGPKGTAVLLLLALAADRRGASFYSRSRMAASLGMSLDEVDQALGELVKLELVAHRPWKPGHADGIWQLLPLPRPDPSVRSGLASAAEILNKIGFKQRP